MNHYVEALPTQLRNVILSAAPADRATLQMVVKIVRGVEHSKREQVWIHFQQNLSKEIQHNVCELHLAFDEVESSIPMTRHQRKMLDLFIGR